MIVNEKHQGLRYGNSSYSDREIFSVFMVCVHGVHLKKKTPFWTSLMFTSESSDVLNFTQSNHHCTLDKLPQCYHQSNNFFSSSSSSFKAANLFLSLADLFSFPPLEASTRYNITAAMRATQRHARKKTSRIR